jgi:hypothetical protein
VTADPKNDDHWTTDGQVRVDVVNAALDEGNDPPVQRQDIIDQAPTFTRETAPTWITEYQRLRDSAIAAAAGETTAGGKLEHDEPTILADASSPPAPASPAVPSKPRPEVPSGAQPSVPPAPQGQASGAVSGALGAPPGAALSALDVPMAKLLRDPQLLQRAVEEIEIRSQGLIREKQRIEEELRALSAKAQLCGRALQLVAPPERPADVIRAFLQGQQRNREARITRTRRFIEAGVSPEDVAKELRGASRLDLAMRRRTDRGLKRPDPRPIAGMSPNRPTMGS